MKTEQDHEGPVEPQVERGDRDLLTEVIDIGRVVAECREDDQEAEGQIQDPRERDQDSYERDAERALDCGI